MRHSIVVTVLLIYLVLMSVLAVGAEVPASWHETANKLFIALQRPEKFNDHKDEIFVNPNDPLVEQCYSDYIDQKVKEILKTSEYNKIRSDYTYTGIFDVERYDGGEEMAEVAFTRIDKLKRNPIRYKFSGSIHIHFSQDAKILSCGLSLELN